MSLIEVCVSIDFKGADADRCKPEARAFIDLAPDDGFGSEHELPLQRLGQAQWLGAFVLGAEQPEHFLYRLGLVAQAGAEFWLTVRHHGLACDLLMDGDTLPAAKCWMVGTCPLPRQVQGRARADAGVVRAIVPKPVGPSIDATRRTSHPRVITLDHYRERHQPAR